MKKSILVMALLLISLVSYSQREGAFRVGMDLGYVPASGGAGISYYIEPKYNIKDNRKQIGTKLNHVASISLKPNTTLFIRKI